MAGVRWPRERPPNRRENHIIRIPLLAAALQAVLALLAAATETIVKKRDIADSKRRSGIAYAAMCEVISRLRLRRRPVTNTCNKQQNRIPSRQQRTSIERWENEGGATSAPDRQRH